MDIRKGYFVFGLGLSVLALFLATRFFFSVKKKESSDSNEDQSEVIDDGIADKVACPDLKQINDSNTQVQVDDVDDDGEENDEKEAESNAAALRAQYDDALSVANKCIRGNAYKRAIDKLTEALNLGMTNIYLRYCTKVYLI